MARIAEPGRALAILDAALSVIIELGYEDTRMSEIAKRAGIANGTIYLYFESKESVVLALADQYHEKLNKKIAPLFCRKADRGSVSEAVRVALRFAIKEHNLFQMVELATGLADVSTPECEKFHSNFSLWLEQQMQEDRIMKAEPSILSDLIIAAMDRAAKRSVLLGKRQAKEYEDTLVTFVQRLLD